MRNCTFLGVALALAMVTGAASAEPITQLRYATSQGDLDVAQADVLTRLKRLLPSLKTDHSLRNAPIAVILVSEQGDINIDLQGFNVEALTIESLQGDVAVTLPNTGAVTGKIATGQGEVRLLAGVNAGVSIDVLRSKMAEVVYENGASEEGEPTHTFSAELEQGNIVVTHSGG